MFLIRRTEKQEPFFLSPCPSDLPGLMAMPRFPAALLCRGALFKHTLPHCESNGIGLLYGQGAPTTGGMEIKIIRIQAVHLQSS